MNPLYYLEHKELPRIIYSKELSKNGVAWIINKFEEVCVVALNQHFGFSYYDVDDFKLSGVRIKDGDETKYHIACFEFPFYKYPDFNLLCPRAYLVCETEYCKNPYYYTVEYDSSDLFGHDGAFLLCGWHLNKSGQLIHPNFGVITGGRESELLRIKEMTNERLGLGNLGL